MHLCMNITLHFCSIANIIIIIVVIEENFLSSVVNKFFKSI